MTSTSSQGSSIITLQFSLDLNIDIAEQQVQASINDDLVRVTGKKIDDLQSVIQASKGWDLGVPLQYENMRS